ncbi:MAG TPA: efflux transporter outer membrane subunit [Stellaceae bacterium]|jgi:NodT family efflux transporter outer membrane factor (OMF) lipoprotein|nr:efflux transporter outer membrane subunit [Stellaceae bacterium]
MLLLAGCTVGPDYKAPDINMPQAFSAAASLLDQLSAPTPAVAVPEKSKTSNTNAVALARWWRALDDPELDALVEQAVAGNLDVKIALARLQEARTEEQVAMGMALPAASVAGAAARGTGSDVTRGRVPSTLTSADSTAGLKQINEIAGFEAGWEIDLFGKYRREIEAAGDETEAAKAARNAVLVAVIGDVVRAYVDLRGLQTRLAILRRNIDVQAHEYDVVETRYNRGLTNELDVTLAQRQLSSLKATVAPLVAQIDAAQYAIAVLLGRMPEDLARELGKPQLLPGLPGRIAPGLPLDLLRRRPDISEQERELAAATARIGVATANLFPHLSLTGAVGEQGQGLGVSPNLVSSIWSAGPSLYWDVLDFGTLDALVNIADLQTQEQASVYRQTILNAVREVDGDIADFTAQQDRLRELSKALTASQRAVTLAQERYDRGLTDFLNVLDAERQEYGLEDEYAEAQQTAADDFAALYKALGGGWENYQAIPPIRKPEPAIVAAFRRLFDRP